MAENKKVTIGIKFDGKVVYLKTKEVTIYFQKEKLIEVIDIFLENNT